MKKILILMLLVSASASASPQKDYFCAELAVRYTAFSISANVMNSKEEYQNYWYKLLLNGNASKEYQTVLMKLIDAAWANRGGDINHNAMTFYSACSNEQST